MIIVMGGINDSASPECIGTIGDTSDFTFYGALKNLTKGLIENYPNAKIVFMTPLYKADKDSQRMPYAEAVKEVCSIYNIPVLDIYNYEKRDTIEANTSDGTHPTSEGHVIITEFIKSELESRNIVNVIE